MYKIAYLFLDRIYSRFWFISKTTMDKFRSLVSHFKMSHEWLLIITMILTFNVNNLLISWHDNGVVGVSLYILQNRQTLKKIERKKWYKFAERCQYVGTVFSIRMKGRVYSMEAHWYPIATWQFPHFISTICRRKKTLYQIVSIFMFGKWH